MNDFYFTLVLVKRFHVFQDSSAPESIGKWCLGPHVDLLDLVVRSFCTAPQNKFKLLQRFTLNYYITSKCACMKLCALFSQKLDKCIKIVVRIRMFYLLIFLRAANKPNYHGTSYKQLWWSLSLDEWQLSTMSGWHRWIPIVIPT